MCAHWRRRERIGYAENDAFVVTACLTDAIKEGEKIWPK
jgi:hypothetical protein